MKSGKSKSTSEKQSVNSKRNRSQTPAGLSVEAGPSWASEFADNRPIANVQRKLQATVDQSPQVQGLTQLQARVDNSPRVQAQAQLQAMIDTSPRQVSQRQQLARLFRQPVQRQQGLGEEGLQMKVESGTVQRQGLESEELVQGKMDPGQRQGVSDGDENRTGLPDSLKGGLEQLSGMDLSAVRVHRNSAKPAQLNALAYAQGNHIHLGPGQEKHLPHEGWHAVQQEQGRVKPTLQAKGVSINDDKGLEKEADIMGIKAAAYPASKSLEPDCKDGGRPFQHQGEYKPGSSPGTQLLKPVVQQKGGAATGAIQGDVIQRKYLNSDNPEIYKQDLIDNFKKTILKGDAEAEKERVNLIKSLRLFFNKGKGKDKSYLPAIRSAVDFLNNFVKNNLDILDDTSGRKEAIGFLISLDIDLEVHYGLKKGGAISKPPKNVKEPPSNIDKKPSIKPSNAKRKSKKDKIEPNKNLENKKEKPIPKISAPVKQKAPEHKWKPGKNLKASSDPAIRAKDAGAKYFLKAKARIATEKETLSTSLSFYSEAIEVERGDKGSESEKIVTVAKGVEIWHASEKLPAELPSIETSIPAAKILRIKSNQSWLVYRNKLATKKDLKMQFVTDLEAKKDYFVRATDVSTKTVNNAIRWVTYGTKSKEKLKVREKDLYSKTAKFEKTNDPLFPESGPKPSHIKQTNLGDCYLKSVMISVAASNPNHLKNMMREDNGTVVVRFYNKDTAVYIKVKKTLPTSAGGKALYSDGEIWARFLQKAFAVYANTYGQYGDAYKNKEAKKKGYEGIESGIEYRLYQVFYGPAEKEAGRSDITSTGNAKNDIQVNQDIIKKLFLFKYHKAEESINLSAGATWEEHLKRLKIIITKLPIKIVKGSKTTFGISIWNLIKTAPKEQYVAEDAGGVLGSKEWMNLKPIDKTAYATANELLHNLKHATTDSSKGNRFIYSEHAYAIIGAVLKDDKGNMINDVKNLTKTDLDKSKITLRNPHKGNTPHLQGTEENKQAESSGKFDLTLAQFIRNFSSLDYGHVKKTK